MFPLRTIFHIFSPSILNQFVIIVVKSHLTYPENKSRIHQLDYIFHYHTDKVKRNFGPSDWVHILIRNELLYDPVYSCIYLIYLLVDINSIIYTCVVCAFTVTTCTVLSALKTIFSFGALFIAFWPLISRVAFTFSVAGIASAAIVTTRTFALTILTISKQVTVLRAAMSFPSRWTFLGTSTSFGVTSDTRCASTFVPTLTTESAYNLMLA